MWSDAIGKPHLPPILVKFRPDLADLSLVVISEKCGQFECIMKAFKSRRDGKSLIIGTGFHLGRTVPPNENAQNLKRFKGCCQGELFPLFAGCSEARFETEI